MKTTTETEIKGIYHSLEYDYQEEITVKIIRKETKEREPR